MDLVLKMGEINTTVLLEETTTDIIMVVIEAEAEHRLGQQTLEISFSTKDAEIQGKISSGRERIVLAVGMKGGALTKDTIKEAVSEEENFPGFTEILEITTRIFLKKGNVNSVKYFSISVKVQQNIFRF